MLKSNPNERAFGSRASELGHECRAFINSINALTICQRINPSSLCHVKTKVVNCQQPGRKLSPEPNHAHIPVSDIQPPDCVR
jgi:hypothetical protein